MICLRTPSIVLSGVALVATSLYAQDLSQYRDFRLGATLASVAKTSGVTLDGVKLVHQRPATIQELRWRPDPYGRKAVPTDPVREVIFSFYNDQLFSIVVDYDRQRTEGLTDTDLIESMTGSYGTPILRATALSTRTRPSEPDGDTVVARWADAESSVTLLRGTYPTSLRLVMALKQVETLARIASAEAFRKDEQEAPQREIDRKQRAAEDGRIAGEKARIVNKPTFKP